MSQARFQLMPIALLMIALSMISCTNGLPAENEELLQGLADGGVDAVVPESGMVQEGGSSSAKVAGCHNNNGCLQSRWAAWSGTWRCTEQTKYCSGTWAGDMKACCQKACGHCRAYSDSRRRFSDTRRRFSDTRRRFSDTRRRRSRMKSGRLKPSTCQDCDVCLTDDWWDPNTPAWQIDWKCANNERYCYNEGSSTTREQMRRNCPKTCNIARLCTTKAPTQAPTFPKPTTCVDCDKCLTQDWKKYEAKQWNCAENKQYCTSDTYEWRKQMEVNCPHTCQTSHLYTISGSSYADLCTKAPTKRPTNKPTNRPTNAPTKHPKPTSCEDCDGCLTDDWSKYEAKQWNCAENKQYCTSDTAEWKTDMAINCPKTCNNPDRCASCDLERTKKFLSGQGSASNKPYAPTETIRTQNVDGCDDEVSETIEYVEAVDEIMSKVGEWHDPASKLDDALGKGQDLVAKLKPFTSTIPKAQPVIKVFESVSKAIRKALDLVKKVTEKAGEVSEEILTPVIGNLTLGRDVVRGFSQGTKLVHDKVYQAYVCRDELCAVHANVPLNDAATVLGAVYDTLHIKSIMETCQTIFGTINAGPRKVLETIKDFVDEISAGIDQIRRKLEEILKIIEDMLNDFYGLLKAVKCCLPEPIQEGWNALTELFNDLSCPIHALEQELMKRIYQLLGGKLIAFVSGLVPDVKVDLELPSYSHQFSIEVCGNNYAKHLKLGYEMKYDLKDDVENRMRASLGLSCSDDDQCLKDSWGDQYKCSTSQSWCGTEDLEKQMTAGDGGGTFTRDHYAEMRACCPKTCNQCSRLSSTPGAMALAEAVASMPAKILETCTEAFADTLSCAATGQCGDTCGPEECALMKWMTDTLKLDEAIHKLSDRAVAAAHKVGKAVGDTADSFQDFASENAGKAYDKAEDFYDFLGDGVGSLYNHGRDFFSG